VRFRANPAHEAAPALRCRPDAGDVDRAAAMIADAQRPLILAGGGVHLSGAAERLTAFAASPRDPGRPHHEPARARSPCNDALNAGLFGRYDRIANRPDRGVGSFCSWSGLQARRDRTKRFTVPPKGKRLIHLDIVAEEFGRTVEPDVALWGGRRAGP
jgi:acetolactate synthase-1/2/3 large subunit